MLSNEALWIEGEDYTSTTFNRHGWYYDDNIQMDLLAPGEPGMSPGDWLVHYSSWTGSAKATYTFNVTEGGDFNWWIRLNPFRNSNGGGNYRYRLDGGDWQVIDVTQPDSRIDLVDPGIDIRFIGWVYGDAMNLGVGQHTVEVELFAQSGDGEVHGGIDVMAFTNFPWAPTGTVPPDPNPPAPGPDDWFMLMAGPDSFSSESIIDMSHLLDDTAGEHGHLMQVDDEFQFADGTPVKFWGICAGQTATEEGMQAQARFYAKHGINMVRQHPVQGVVGQLQGSPGNYYLDPDNLDRFDRWFSILKDNGIYMTWSIFYHHKIQSSWNIVPTAMHNELSGGDTYGFASFVEEYQDSQWNYANLLLNHVNPYTGIRYADDPALAIVEARNEDSIFFHNPLGHDFVHGSAAPNHQARLRQMWHQWVSENYANDTELAAAWGAGMQPNDSVNADPVTQPMAMYAAWEMDADGVGVQTARMGDFIQFLAEMQRDTYQTYYDRLRGIGYDGVVVSTAWKAGGPAANAANLWTDDAMDAIDRHNYFGGGAGGHGITTGAVNNDTHLDQAGRGILSSGLWQVEDKPFIMTEWTQKPPNQWKAEISPLFAFYGMGLQGWDASYQFAGSRSYMGNGWPSMSSYVTETPHYIGQFPALSYAVYNGHFEEGALAAARRVSLDDAFSGIDVLSQDFTGGGYDENEPSGNLETPTEVLAIGRVTAKVADGQEHSYASDWTQCWDDLADVVHSNTGQLTWDYGDETVIVHSDKTQGIVGFPGETLYDLPGVMIYPHSEFMSLLLTPLDNLPLDQSEHILVTAMAKDQQHGAMYDSYGTTLLETGGPPLMMEPVKADIVLKGDQITSVKAVDVYGVPTDQVVPHTGNFFTIDGRYATYYYEIKRDTGSVVDSDAINFNDYTVDYYAAGGQGTDGSAAIEDDGATLHLQGNTWRKINLPYTVTPQTVIEFDYKSSTQGEIQGIGFDTDESVSKDSTFNLYGVTNWGILGHRDYADSAPNWKHYTINAGEYFVGDMNHMIFANDDDAAGAAEEWFRNVKVYERAAEDTLNFNDYTVEHYAVGSQGADGSATVEDDGATLHIAGNAWRKIALPYSITPRTVLEFDYKSTVRGEIQGIGFDDDDEVSRDRTFALYGNSTWGILAHQDYEDAAPDWKHYSIDLGTFYGGDMTHLIFANDDDAAGVADGYFRNVRVYDLPANDVLNFNDYTAEFYATGTQGTSGSVTVQDNGATLRIGGNAWRKIALPTTIEPDTVLEFDFKSTTRGEIQGIGFDNDDEISSDRTFQLYGTQHWGIPDYETYAPAAPDWKHYKIDVGDFYTGDFSHLIFAHDDDANAMADSYYRNVKIYTGVPDDTLDFGDHFVEFYDATHQGTNGTAVVEDNGATLHLAGNAWRKIALPTTITPNTVIEFDFKSTVQGEIQGIGFDTDDSISPDTTFQLYGIQHWGISDYEDYAGTAPDWKHYTIPVGTFFTGDMDYLIFAHDDDANALADSFYRNVKIYEV